MQLCNYLWQRVHPVLACVVAWALRVLVIVCPLQFTSDVAPADGRRGQGLHINRRRAHQRQKEVRAPARTIVRGCRPLRETPATCMHIWCPPFVLATDRCAICSARHIDEIVHSTCMCVVACMDLCVILVWLGVVIYVLFANQTVVIFGKISDFQIIVYL